MKLPSLPEEGLSPLVWVAFVMVSYGYAGGLWVLSGLVAEALGR